MCTNIENCADIRCTNPTDHYCEECESDNGVALGERGYENLNFSCERKLKLSYTKIIILLKVVQYEINISIILIVIHLS